MNNLHSYLELITLENYFIEREVLNTLMDVILILANSVVLRLLELSDF